MTENDSQRIFLCIVQLHSLCVKAVPQDDTEPPSPRTRLATVLSSTTELNSQLLIMSLIFINAASHTVGLKMRKRLVVLQALAILLAVFQYGMRAAGQEEGGHSGRILSSVFQPYLTAR